MILTMPPPRPRGLGYGWGISLAVHALLAAWLLHLPAPRPDAGPAPKRIDFVLVAPRPAPPPAVTRPPAAPAPVAASASATAPARTPRPAATAQHPMARPHALSTAAPDSIPGQASAPEADVPASAPAFDMAAARNTARAAAREGNPSLVVTPRLAPTLDPAGEMRQEQLQRNLERARRSDCKSAYSGLGLFALIPLVKDTVTGTGCKW